MRLSDQTRNVVLWNTIEKIRLGIGKTDKDMAEFIELSVRRYRSMRHSKREIPLSSFSTLAENLDISYDRLFAGSIDVKALARKLQGDQEAIPEVYTLGAFSRRRTVGTILNYVELTRGLPALNEILRYFQIPHSYFDDPEKTVNVLLNTDICQYLGDKMDFSKRELYWVGLHSTNVNKSGELGKIFQDDKSCKTLYEHIFNEYVDRWDRNFDYSLRSLTKDRVVIGCRQSPRVLDALKLKKFGNVSACTVRNGVAGSFPFFIDKHYAFVKETRCVHRGDPECVMEVNFNEFIKPRVQPALRLVQ